MVCSFRFRCPTFPTPFSRLREVDIWHQGLSEVNLNVIIIIISVRLGLRSSHRSRISGDANNEGRKCEKGECIGDSEVDYEDEWPIEGLEVEIDQDVE
jgi:hypothetical protein